MGNYVIKKNDGPRILNSKNRYNVLPKNENEWVEILRRAANAGMSAIESNYTPSSRTKVTKRGVGGDLTLEIDEASESAIYKSLVSDLGKESFVFVSEEMGEINDDYSSDRLNARPVIMCDPLDGSHNAQVGLPLFSVSLSVLGLNRRIRPKEKRHLGDVDVALILNIPSKDEFYAIKGFGAFHNGSRITNDIKRKNGSQEEEKRFPTIGIECGDVDYLKQVMKNLSSQNVYKLRVLGSAAISYCLLAEGTFDGFLFVQPNGARTIDSPAGYLIAKEAGRVFGDLSGENKDIDQVELGFHSRINLIGARDRKAFTKFAEIVRSANSQA